MRIGLLVLALGLGPVASAPIERDRGDALPLALTWDAPPECPHADDVRRDVAERVRAPMGASLRVEGRISRLPDGQYEAQLSFTTKDGTNTRSVVAPDCRTVASATTVFIAVAIGAPVAAPGGALVIVPEQPGTTGETIVPTTPSDSPTIPAAPGSSAPQRIGSTEIRGSGSPDVVSTQPPTSETSTSKTAMMSDRSTLARNSAARTKPDPRSPRERRTWQVTLRAGLGVQWGAVPSLGPGVQLGLGMRGRRWRVEATGTFWVPRELEHEGVTTSLSLGYAALRGCYEPRVRRTSFPLCGGAEAGAMIGRANEISQAGSLSLVWAAVAASVGVTWAPVRRFAVWLDLVGTGHLTRPRFVVEGLGEMHRAEAGGVRLLGGVEVRI